MCGFLEYPNRYPYWVALFHTQHFQLTPIKGMEGLIESVKKGKFGTNMFFSDKNEVLKSCER